MTRPSRRFAAALTTAVLVTVSALSALAVPVFALPADAVRAFAVPADAAPAPIGAQQGDVSDDAPRTLVDTGDDSVQGRLDGLVDLAGSRELRTVLAATAFLGVGALLVAVPLGLLRSPRTDGPPGTARRRPPGGQPPPDRPSPPDGPPA